MRERGDKIPGRMFSKSHKLLVNNSPADEKSKRAVQRYRGTAAPKKPNYLGFLIVSTTWVAGLLCAVFTDVERPVPAFMPILLSELTSILGSGPSFSHKSRTKRES
jgi:hypothetical protein